MPILSRHGPRLLRTVQGKVHASSDDHIEQNKMHDGQATEDMTEDQINADPISSGDEAQAPPSPPSQASQNSASSNRGRSSKSKRTAAAPQGSRKNGGMRVPRSGSFKEGRAHKAKEYGEDKENHEKGPSSSAEKRRAREAIFSGMEYSAPKRQKTTSRATYNIHAGTMPKKTFGKGAAKGGISYTRAMNNPIVKENDDETNEIDTLYADLDEMNREASAQDVDSETPKPPSSSAKPARRNLLASLGAYKQPTSSDPANASGASTPLSSQTADTPAASGDNLQTLEQDVADLPDDDQVSKCAICQEAIDPDFLFEFWKYRQRTYRNQDLFCTEHKRHSAQVEYKANCYPDIDWVKLPERIRRFKPQLRRMLRNGTEIESKFRKRHAEKLLSGKAAALPSRRNDKKTEELEKEMFDDFDAGASSTGYYGPRGKRSMMETITTELSDDIREAVADDPVVGRSGFAAYLQAVLVPELTVLLVMEDLDVSEAKAEEEIEKSNDMGALLNQEVDDEVAQRSDEDTDEEGDDR